MEESKRCQFCDEVIRVNAIKCRHCGSIVSSDTYPSGSSKDPDTLLKQIVGEQYEVSEVVGKGGMAMVYRAKHKSLQREVALKVVHQNLVHDSEFINRFLREARVGASLSHPNIVTIYDVGTIGPINYMAMEFLTGKTLRQVIHAKGKLSVDDAIHYLAPIAKALAYIHDKGLVHRDIKSSNVIIAGKRAVLCDFGIVFVRGEERLSTMGSVVGTPEYMSPEQAEGKEEVDHRADIYSLGVMFYEALTGTVPFHNDNPLATVHSLLNDIPVEPIELNPEVPVWLNSLVLACMTKSKEDRIQDCSELVDSLNKRAYVSPDMTVRFNTTDLKGMAVTQKVARAQREAKKLEEPVKKKKGKGLKVFAIVLLSLIVLAASAFYFHKGIQEEVLVFTILSKGQSMEKAQKYEDALSHYISSLEKYPANDKLIAKVSDLRAMLIEKDQTAAAETVKTIPENEVKKEPVKTVNTEQEKAADTSDEPPESPKEETKAVLADVAGGEVTNEPSSSEAEKKIDPVIPEVKKEEVKKEIIADKVPEKPKADPPVAKKADPPVVKKVAPVKEAVETIKYAQLPDDYMAVLKGFGIELVYVPLVNKGFYIGKYEITQKVWKGIAGDAPSMLEGDDHPVENINQSDISRFLTQLNTMSNLEFRLPTSAEWEQAAKSGKDTKYSGGDRIEMVAWYEANTSGSHTSVGKLQPNAAGIFDMSGNVAELCSDNVRKGGSYLSTSNNCEIVASKAVSPETRDWTVGIRICLTYTE